MPRRLARCAPGAAMSSKLGHAPPSAGGASRQTPISPAPPCDPAWMRPSSSSPGADAGAEGHRHRVPQSPRRAEPGLAAHRGAGRRGRPGTAGREERRRSRPSGRPARLGRLVLPSRMVPSGWIAPRRRARRLRPQRCRRPSGDLRDGGEQRGARQVTAGADRCLAGDHAIAPDPDGFEVGAADVEADDAHASSIQL